MKLPLPATIVTGALGVGKTTAIASLMAQKPAGIVNILMRFMWESLASASRARPPGGPVQIGFVDYSTS